MKSTEKISRNKGIPPKGEICMALCSEVWIKCWEWWFTFFVKWLLVWKIKKASVYTWAVSFKTYKCKTSLQKDTPDLPFHPTNSSSVAVMFGPVCLTNYDQCHHRQQDSLRNGTEFHCYCEQTKFLWTPCCANLKMMKRLLRCLEKPKRTSRPLPPLPVLLLS